jgi:hypothetical protein
VKLLYKLWITGIYSQVTQEQESMVAEVPTDFKEQQDKAVNDMAHN